MLSYTVLTVQYSSRAFLRRPEANRITKKGESMSTTDPPGAPG
jgi:hypothetical protein